MSKVELKKKWWAASKPKTAKGTELDRALGLMSKYAGGVTAIDDLIDEIFAQADTLKTMIDKRRARGKK